MLPFVLHRAQFGQSRSFNSLSHKNLIMNMEPLVPALPSTNEYEDTVTDNGRMGLHTDTQTHTSTSSRRSSLESHMVPPVCIREHMLMHNPPTESVN